MLKNSMKVIVIGDMSVGKTCIVTRLVKNQFNEDEKATVAASFVTTTVEKEGKKFALSIWDTVCFYFSFKLFE